MERFIFYLTGLIYFIMEKTTDKTTTKSTDIIYLIKRYIFIISFFLTFLAILIIMVLAGVEPFGAKTILIGDSLDQYMPFFSVLKTKLESGDISVHNFSYSWEVGLGTNFLLLFFYYLASPFNLLILLVPKDGIVGMLTIIIMLKIAFCSATFSFYISKEPLYSDGDMKGRTAMNLALSAGYGLSGYICGYFWNVMWLDSLILFPIVIYGLKKLIKGESPLIYIISLCFTIYLNFYMAFMICIFLVLYVLLYRYDSIKIFFKRGLTFALSSLLAAGMSAISLFVIYYGIGHTMTAGAGAPSLGLFGNVFYSLRQAFIFTKPVTVDSTRYNGYANIYAGTIVILLFFIYFFSAEIKLSDKLRRIGILLILFLSMNERVLNYIWHGFHEQFLIPNRFSFIVIFVLLDMGFEAFVGLENIRLKRLLPAMVLAVVYPVICFVFVDFDGYTASTTVILLNLVVLTIYALIILAYNRLKDMRLGILITLCSFIIIELTGNAFLAFKNVTLDKDISSLYAMDEFIDSMKYSSDKGNSEELNDSLLYREELMEPVLTNGISYTGLKGATTFCSTISGDSLYTMMDLGFRGMTNHYSYQGDTEFTSQLLGIKNIYYMNDNNELGVFQNEFPLPIGFVVSRGLEDYTPDSENDSALNINNIAMLSANSNDLPIFTDVSKDMQPLVYGADVKVSEDMANSLYLEKTGMDEAVLELDYTVEDAGTYYLYMRATNFDNLTVLINENIYAQGAIINGMLEIPELCEGDKLSVYFETNADTPIIWYLDRYDKEVADAYIGYFAGRGITVTSFNEGDFSFDADVSEDEMIMLTIPYDKGWKVYDMDNLLETVPVVRGFTGIELGAGHHNIRMVYTPEGYGFGMMITVISWMICIFYFIKYDRRRYNEK